MDLTDAARLIEAVLDFRLLRRAGALRLAAPACDRRNPARRFVDAETTGLD
jgi:hypothetical protein